MFESLEERRLLAFTINITVSDGVLRVDATRQRNFISFFVDDGGDWVLAEPGYGIRSYKPNAFKRIVVNAGRRGDVVDLSGCPIPVTINARGGDDVIQGGFKGDQVDGGPGDDTFQTPWGADVLRGRDGFDKVSFSNRTADLKVSLNGIANDGQFILGAFESMNVGTDVEHVVGGSGDDLLVGNQFDNQLEGGDGNDTLAGGAGDDLLIGGSGVDHLLGEGGNDVLRAQDSAMDYLNGGRGYDDWGADPGDSRYKVEFQGDLF